MPKCDLKIHLARADATYTPGEPIEGTVELRAREDLVCRRLLFTREWRTHGRGNTDAGGRRESTLGDAPIRLRTGEVNKFPFRFSAPGEPFTYRGHHFSVDWYLRARADLPRALDPRAEQEFLLVPSKESPTSGRDGMEDFEDTVSAGSGPEEPAAARDAHWAELFLGEGLFRACLVLPAAGILLLGCLLWTWFIVDLAGGTLRWAALGAGAPLVLLPALFLYRVRKRRWAARRLGGVELVVEPRTARAGDPIRCRVRFQPPKEVGIQRVGAALLAEETAVRDDGTVSTVYKHVVHEEETLLLGETRAGAPRPVEAEGTLTVPGNAPPSFRARHHRLGWIVAARIGIRGWPDWRRKVPVRIRG